MQTLRFKPDIINRKAFQPARKSQSKSLLIGLKSKMVAEY